MIPGLEHLPAWAMDGALGIVRALFRLAAAPDDYAREVALMEAAEATKAALDRKKFGG